MFHRLLACLALVTGLAAIGIPAEAAISHAASLEAQAGAAADGQTGEQVAVACDTARSGRRTTDAPPARVPGPCGFEHAPVLIGIDRAHE